MDDPPLVRIYAVPPLKYWRSGPGRCRKRADRVSEPLMYFKVESDDRMHSIGAKISGPLLAIALTNPGRRLYLTELISTLWPDPDEEPEFPEDFVRAVVFRLRRRFWTLGLHLDIDGFNGKNTGGYVFRGVRRLTNEEKARYADGKQNAVAYRMGRATANPRYVSSSGYKPKSAKPDPFKFSRERTWFSGYVHPDEHVFHRQNWRKAHAE